MPRLALHPACRIFPPLPEDELEALAEDISANGLKNPIVLHEGKILDGRNRYEACILAGVEPTFSDFEGDDPVSWVISQNLVRRHLTASQRAVLALDLLPLLEKEAKERQRLSLGRGKRSRNHSVPFSSNGEAAEVAARMTKSNAKYVRAVKQIREKAPELIEKIRTGELSVTEASRFAQHAIGSTKRLTQRIAHSKDDVAKLVCGDCLDLIPALDEMSVSLVVTSPPYAEQRNGQYAGITEERYAEWTTKWMGLLRPKLTDNASVLIVLRSHVRNGILSDYVLRTRLALRDDGWKECDEMIWLKPDAPPLGNNQRPRRTWESILWFSRSGRPFCDSTACGRDSGRLGFAGSLRFGVGGSSPVHNGQRLSLEKGRSRCSDVFVAAIGGIEEGIDHPAMFPMLLAEQLVRTFSRPGDLVLDCFAGAGTTLCAAKKHGRDFRGFDFDRKFVRIALERLAATTG